MGKSSCENNICKVDIFGPGRRNIFNQEGHCINDHRSFKNLSELELVSLRPIHCDELHMKKEASTGRGPAPI